MYREYVEDLVKINEDDLKESGVKLILIGCADTKFLDAYIKDTKLKFPIYVDPERKLYKMIGLLDKPRKTVMCRESKHVKSGKVVGLMKMVWKTMTSGYQELQGDMEQQGGAFILGPGNDVHFYHIDLVSNDHCPINDLMEKCGLPFINFPNDKRPENI
ncbi:unnamed protein product [Owenia fusiformis]|nr:unnamed protein product [Owenia fusiformis]